MSDSEAFLLGHYVERLADRREPVPVWAWTNLLAHASEPELRAAARSSELAGRDEWRAARADLVAQLLSTSGPDRLVREVQVAVLQPLELRLASRPTVLRWDHRMWSDTVRAALGTNRATRRT
ncbi:MAG: hypothetical protein ACREOV_02735 [Candidatus Dormibacteraceae bacterium]